MKILWLGHSCFLMTLSNNMKIVTDPFSEEIGYKLPKIKSDVVTISHNHSDHNNLKSINGNYVVFDKNGEFHKNGMRIKGISSYHDKVKGILRGKNIIYKFEMDGLNVCHLGDLGHNLNSEQIEQIGKVDILLLPIGGKYTINVKKTMKIIKLLKPSVTIPMHYQTEGLKFSLGSIDKFISMLNNVKYLDNNEVEINIDNLKSYSGILILKCINKLT